MKQRIFILTPGIFPIPSARSSSVENVVQQVALRLKDECDFVIFGTKGDGLPDREARGSLTYIRVHRRSRLHYLKQAASWIRGLNPSIIQVENRPRFVRYLKARFPRIPVVLSLHSTTYLSKSSIPPSILEGCLRSADRIVVNSHFLRNYVLGRFPKLGGKIAVHHLGVDTGQFRSRWLEQEETYRRHFLRSQGLQDKQIILYVGRLLRIKGVHRLLEAMPGVMRSHPDAVLVIVGSAYLLSSRATSYVRKLHRAGKALGGRVRFVPYVPHNRIHEWFRAADMLVVPSERREAFGLVNVEAMAVGIPVIACRAGGMKEILLDGRTGFLIPPDRLRMELPGRIRQLLNDPGLRRKMGECCLRHVNEHFTWDHTAARYAQLYRSMAGLYAPPDAGPPSTIRP